MTDEQRTYRKGMVMTVGLGDAADRDGYITAHAKAINEPNPDIVILIASRKSNEEVGQFIQPRFEELYGSGPTFEPAVLDNYDDVHVVLHKAWEAMKRILDLGVPPTNVDVHFTFGTKTMSVGVAIAHLMLEDAGKFRSTGGPRSTSGRVPSGAEEAHTFSLAPVTALRNLRQAENMIRLLQFRAAEEVTRDILDSHLTEHDQRHRDMLVAVAAAYDAWDKFDHKEAARLFLNIEKEQFDCGAFALDQKFHKRIDGIGNAGASGNPRRYSADLIADLFANAQRRMIRGEWDDAVGRLYRCCEMLAQFVLLHTFEIDSGNAYGTGNEAARSKVREVLSDKSTDSDGMVRAGLRGAYEILQVLGHPVGDAWNTGESNVKALLSSRNDSLLAHGSAPVTRDMAESFRDRFAALARVEIAEFDQRVEQLQFPWLRD